MKPMAIPELPQVFSGIAAGALTGIKQAVISSVGCSMTSRLRPISFDNLLIALRGHRHSLAATTRTASCVKTVTGVRGSWHKYLLFPHIFPLT